MEKIKLEICSGTSCHLMGAYDLHLNIKKIEQEYEKIIEITTVTCLGNCGKGPNIRVNGEVFSQVTPGQFKELIKKMKDRRGEDIEK